MQFLNANKIGLKTNFKNLFQEFLVKFFMFYSWYQNHVSTTNEA